MSMDKELVFKSQIQAPSSEVFDWHVRPRAFERLQPPWEQARVIEEGGVSDGAETVLEMKLGPFSQRWHARHHDVDPGRSFSDTQERGPFTVWEHRHAMIPADAQSSWMEDRVRYRVPFGGLGALVAGKAIARRIARMFAYRHATLAQDLARHHAFAHVGPMRIAVTGASGMLGAVLCRFLETGGHQVIRVGRMPSGVIDVGKLAGADAVVHLAGENVGGGRWSEARKARIMKSRVEGTRAVVAAMAAMPKRPRVLVCASAIGIYGIAPAGVVDEKSPEADDFLASVVKAWESETRAAAEAGIRVVNARFGVVLSPTGGALSKLLLPFRFGAGGPIGSGKQPMSWVSIDDAVYAIHHALCDDKLAGPVDVVAPEVVDNATFGRTLGRVLHRPSFAPLPAFVVKLIFGEMGESMLLGGSNVSSEKLRAHGFKFAYPSLEGALRHLLGRGEQRA